MKAWPLAGIFFVTALLALAHWFLYATWTAWWGLPAGAASLPVKLVTAFLAILFPLAAMVGFRFTGPLVRALYFVASVWLGLLNFLFFSAVLCRLLGVVAGLGGWTIDRPAVAHWLLALSVAATLYGMINARWVRVERMEIALRGLPESWRGRTALVMSDVHLGHIHGVRSCRKLARMARRLEPDVIFLPGDLFDGSHAVAERVTAPLLELAPPFGIFYTAGNHDEIGPLNHYTEVLRRGGVRVLENECVTIDGLDIVGVPYGDSSFPIRLKATLASLGLKPHQAAVLLNHVPNRLPIAEQAGIDLQISGHTHGGQIFPFTWLTRRAFGRFTTGLNRYGRMQVLTSYGAGTWGPPMRVGTRSEVVLIRFERA